MQKPEFVVERAQANEKDFCDVFELMLALYREEGYVQLDPAEAAKVIYCTLNENMTFVARLVSGEAIGALPMTELPYWYSTETMLQSIGFYVRPEHRRGRVGVALLRAARDEGNARDKITYVTIHNPDRRPKRTRTSIESQTLGFVPLGHTLKLR